jgi:hypothetical protein
MVRVLLIEVFGLTPVLGPTKGVVKALGYKPEVKQAGSKDQVHISF